MSAEISSCIEQIGNQKTDDEELQKLLKEELLELLLKIENERKLLKRRKIQTEIAHTDLIFVKRNI